MKLNFKQDGDNFHLQQQILHDLQSVSGGKPRAEVAFVLYKDVVYYALFDFQGLCPSSATIKLIQGIFDQHIDLSFFILRQRIFTTEEISPKNAGMVKLAAKRITRTSATDHGIKTTFQFQQVGTSAEAIFAAQSYLPESQIPVPQCFISAADVVSWVERIASASPQAPRLHDQNRAIGCIIVDRDYRLLSWSSNRASLNKTLHAETRAAQIYFLKTQNPLPVGAKIFVTLRPCRMCAGILHGASVEPKSLEVFFKHDDLGPSARNTVLHHQCSEFRLQ